MGTEVIVECKIPLFTTMVVSDLLIYSRTLLNVCYIASNVLNVGDLLLTLRDIVFIFKALLEGKHMHT